MAVCCRAPACTLLQWRTYRYAALRDVEVVFKALDRNNDRKISRSEATVKGSVSKRFDGIDSDADGYLSKQEFAARPSPERFE